MGSYVACDDIACCLEEKTLCVQRDEYKREVHYLPDDVVVHIDIPLTLEHQVIQMKKAGFQDVEPLYQNAGTMKLRAQKSSIVL